MREEREGVIRRTLRRHRAPPAAQEDLEQDVAEALLRLGTLRTACPSTWIWKVCRNVIIDHRKRELLRRSVESEVAAELLSPIAGPEEVQDAADARVWIYRALWQLPATCRQVLFLRELDGASYRDIARALRITELAARVAHHRGMRSLAKLAEATPDW